MSEPHKWSMNITCPKCGHRGDAEESFPCCEHVAQLEATQAALVGALEDIATALLEGEELHPTDDYGEQVCPEDDTCNCALPKLINGALALARGGK